MVRFLTTLGAIFAGLLVAFGVVAVAATLMAPGEKPKEFLCFDYDQSSSYATIESELRSQRSMIGAVTYVNGDPVKVYIPKSNLLGCREMDSGR
jgi:hypothetical protein